MGNEESEGLTMGIRISGYDVVCDICGTPVAFAICIPRDEADEIIANARDCIVVSGKVYCCEECKEKAEAAEVITERLPEPSGLALRDLPGIQADRLDKWMANALPVKLSPSLQAAKDAAKPTCGDCRFFDELSGDDNRPCLAPLPFWVSPKSSYWPWRGDERTKDCPCFERKGATK